MAFVCQAGMKVTSDAKCEHCGATERGTCGRLPAVQHEVITELSAALEDILNYTGGAEGPLNDDYVVDRARTALDRAKGLSQ